MVLRIEDTDDSRNRPELTDAIFEYLEWLGIDYDEGPHYQSQRRGCHREAVQQLRGEAGQGQIANASVGMAQNIGGSGATIVTHILGG